MSNGEAPAVIVSHGPGGLGAVRSLAREGITVFAIAYEASDPVCRSRFPSRLDVIPDGEDASKEEHLLEVLRTLPTQGAALMTTSDRLVAFLSNHREELLRKYRYAMPPKDLLDALNDKSREVSLIASLGIPVPRTVERLPATPDDLERELRYPIIMKPHSFAASAEFPRRHAVISDRNDLYDFYSEWQGALHAVLAQEVIPGPQSNSWVCSCTYNADHELLDCMVRQKFRTNPPDFGTSTYSVCHDNPEIVDLARDIGRKLAYVGHAGIEFRRDDRDHEFKYIELNPRMGGETGFDQACGLPTVMNTYRVALGQKVQASGNQQRDGLIFLNLQRDLISLRLKGASLFEIAAVHASLLFKPKHGLYFAWDDPMPGLVVAFRFMVEACQLWIRKVKETVTRASVNGPH